MERSLGKDVRIDKYRLPDEWERQPELFRYWAEEYAISTLERDQAKEQLELIDADLDLAIRKNPEKYGLDKVAESSVKSAIRMQPEHKDAQEVLNQAKYAVTRFQAARDAMEHRRDALKSLSKLALGDFYSANAAPSDASIKKSSAVQEKFAAKTRRRGLVR